MSVDTLIGSVELGLIYALMALGLYVSYRILDVADITTDGSFVLGAAVSAVVTAAGHPFLGLLAAVGLGSLAGAVTAFLQTKLKIQPILAGILTMTALYSINIFIMGKGNIPLLKVNTVFTTIAGLTGGFAYSKILTALLFSALAGVFVVVFLRTSIGLAVRATGDNPDMVRASSINPHLTTFIGLMIANALVGLSGGLLAQYQMFADVGMGTGIVVIGLASLIIGEILLGRRSIPVCVIGVFVGSIIYRVIIAVALRTSSATNLKLISSLIVTLAIAYPAVRESIARHKLVRKAEKDA